MNKEEIRKALEGKGAVMEIGSPNDGYARFFTGRSWLASLSEDKDIPVYNVTFETAPTPTGTSITVPARC